MIETNEQAKEWDGIKITTLSLCVQFTGKFKLAPQNAVQLAIIFMERSHNFARSNSNLANQMMNEMEEWKTETKNW